MRSVVNYIQQFGRFGHNARLYLLTNTLTSISGGMVLVLYTLYLSALGYGTNLIGLVLFVATLGIGIAIFPAGLCVDRFSGKAILIWSTILIGIAGVGQILFRNPVLLCISVFVAGIGIALQFVLEAPFLTTNSVPAERAQLFSLNIVLSLIATVIGELLGGVLPLWLREHAWTMVSLPQPLSWVLATQPLARSYQITILFAGVLAIPGFIPLLFMSNDRPTHVRPKRQRSWRPIGQPHQLPYRQRLHTFLHSPLAILVGVNILVGFGAGMLLPYFSLFFVQHLGATSALFGLIDGAANTLNAIAILLAPWIAMRIGRMATILLPRLLGIPIMLCIGISTFLPLAAILYPLRQGISDMPNGILEVFSMEVIPPQHRGLANSSYQSAHQVAWAAAIPIGGLIISHLGYTPVFLLTAVLYLLALALIWWHFGSKKDSYGYSRELDARIDSTDSILSAETTGLRSVSSERIGSDSTIVVEATLAASTTSSESA